MKVLIIGSNGFIGKSVQKVLSLEHEVFVANRQKSGEKSYKIDLLNPEIIEQVLREVQPDAVINCAGIINAADDFTLNITFTKNLLEAIIKSDIRLKRIIISGSAAEYGLIRSSDLPVGEETPLNATSEYGASKVLEEQTARKYAKQNSLPIVVARIFNPIGSGMKGRFLIPNLVQQISDYKNRQTDTIKINRLDSARDYVSVDDISNAFNALLKGEPTYFAYNIGSGVSTTNAGLLQMLLEDMNLANPQILQTSDIVEPLAAVQADISRLKKDFDWSPKVSLEKTIKEIIDEQHR